MKVLYVNSNRIKKTDIVWGLIESGIDVDIYSKEIIMDSVIPEEIENLVGSIREYDFVISQNFIPSVAESCNIVNVPYVSWIYDSPQYHLYQKEALYSTNYVFAFDKKQCERLKSIGVNNVFYLPMAGNISKASSVIVSDSEVAKYSADVSFVGSLYKKNLFSNYIAFVSQKGQSDIAELFQKFHCSWNGCSIYNQLSKETASELEKLVRKEDFSIYNIDSRYAAETLMLCYELSSRERIDILSSLSKNCKTVLHTNEDIDTIDIPGCLIKPPIYGDEMYKVYYASKINLNITMRSIESGIPLRIFDIMSVAGCVFTNYQEEVGELFDIDKDIIVYSSIDELIDKAKYFLEHDTVRTNIGINGYNRVREEYNYKRGIEKILRTIF